MHLEQHAFGQLSVYILLLIYEVYKPIQAMHIVTNILVVNLSTQHCGFLLITHACNAFIAN